MTAGTVSSRAAVKPVKLIAGNAMTIDNSPSSRPSPSMMPPTNDSHPAMRRARLLSASLVATPLVVGDRVSSTAASVGGIEIGPCWSTLTPSLSSARSYLSMSAESPGALFRLPVSCRIVLPVTASGRKSPPSHRPLPTATTWVFDTSSRPSGACSEDTSVRYPWVPAST